MAACCHQILVSGQQSATAAQHACGRKPSQSIVPASDFVCVSILLQVGLLHGLGKLLAHPAWGTEPQWAVCGESFPVGCAHSPLIACPQGFSVNPDRRRRMYNTPVGMYKKCASGSIIGIWPYSGAE